jgi:hypothetical protein
MQVQQGKYNLLHGMGFFPLPSIRTRAQANLVIEEKSVQIYAVWQQPNGQSDSQFIQSRAGEFTHVLNGI